MDDEIDSPLLERFLAGECTAAEREQVVRWAGDIPERQALLNALRTAWAQIGTPARRYDSTKAWAAVSAKLTGTSDAVPRPIHRNFGDVAPVFPWRIAAAVLLVAGLGGVALWQYQPSRAPRH